jgi:hypothetical protein
MVACTEATVTKKNDALIRPKIAMLPFHWSALGFPLERLQTGDLVLRHSEGFSSDIFKGASKRENLYSHAGIALRNLDGTVEVYHMLGGVENPNFNLKKDSVQAFVSPTFAKAFAIYHYDFTDEERIHIDSLVRYYYKSNLQFDMDFDLKSDKKMYCSEFVYKVILFATHRKDYIHLSVENGKKFVGIDDLYLNIHSTLLINKNYEKNH